MTRQRSLAALVFGLALAGAGAIPAHSADGPPAKRKVVVELFSSQGCDMCPSAEKALGALAEGESIIPIAFHVDYFNNPWHDPFSDPRFSEREMRYSRIYDRENGLNNPSYLYLTPLLMVDGRAPMLGTDDAKAGTRALPKAKDAIRKARAVPVQVDLALTLSGEPKDRSREAVVTLSPRFEEMKGHDVLVEVLVVQDGISTKVGSGELAGKTYAARFTARSLEIRPTTLQADGKTTVRVPVELPRGGDPSRIQVVAMAQDDESGAIHQADMAPWSPPVRKSRP